MEKIQSCSDARLPNPLFRLRIETNWPRRKRAWATTVRRGFVSIPLSPALRPFSLEKKGNSALSFVREKLKGNN